MAIYVKFLPISVNFYLTSHYLFSYHVIMAANLKKFLISPDFPVNFRKCAKFQRIISKALRVMNRSLWGVSKDPLVSIGLRSLDHFQISTKIGYPCPNRNLENLFISRFVSFDCKIAKVSQNDQIRL